MKKRIPLFLMLASANLFFGQATLVVQAPLNNSTSSTSRAPNGLSGYSYLSACFLVLQTELYNLPSGANISSFGFTLNTGASSSVPGNFTVCLQNTSDMAYQKGTSYTTAVVGMTQVFANVMTVPLSATTTSMVVTLSSPFNYTGGGLYVAYNWISSGPFAGTGATCLSETNTLPLPNGGGALAFGSAPSPSLILTNSRPSFLFGLSNPNSNDLEVIAIEAPGKVALSLNTGHIIKAYIVNSGTTTATNKSVNLTVSGANAFTDNQTITSLAPGSGILLSFTSFNPLIAGLNTISVSVGSDQNNLNNSATASQSVTCSDWAQNPPSGTYTVNSVGFSTGAGILATTLFNPVTASIAGVRGSVSSFIGNVSGQLYGVLLSSSGSILATSNTITITNAMLGTFQDFTFSSSQALTASTNYYIGVAQYNPTNQSYYPFGTLSAYYLPANLYSYTGLGGGGMTILTQNYGFFGFEAVYDSNVNLNIVSTPTAACIGSCAKLSAPGLTSYTWSTGSFNQTITACPVLGQNTYSVAGTSTLGCPASAIISVPIKALPLIGITTSTTAICLGSSVSFTATGASSYSWSGGSFNDTTSASPIRDTIYIVTGTDLNGCTSSDSLNISVISLTVSVSSNTAICKGKSVALSASSTDNYTYNWLIGNGLPFANTTVNPTITTTYTVDAFDINGCMQSNTVMVTVNPNPTVTITSGKAIICKGESVVLTAGGAASYSWNPSAATLFITVSPKSNTVYNVTGIDTNGCRGTASITQSVSACTGLVELSANQGSLRIYPNPSSGWITLHSENTSPGSSLEIYSSLGALVGRRDVTGEDTTLDLSNQPAGVYFVHLIVQGGSNQVTKIIKQ